MALDLLMEGRGHQVTTPGQGEEWQALSRGGAMPGPSASQRSRPRAAACEGADERGALRTQTAATERASLVIQPLYLMPKQSRFPGGGHSLCEYPPPPRPVNSPSDPVIGPGSPGLALLCS